MSTKKEEERNEKIIRGLMKLPPNRRCINCDSLGPQYVCTNFWTFVCTTCSGIHREFTHRVKSVSMAKFSTQEVEALQKGGNQRAREMFLIEWDPQGMRLPNNSNIDKIREFIKNVYVSKKYAGGMSTNKPPRDAQSLKNHEDHRRASSYHSFSQSPPYEHQYEDRLYGKQTGMLSRKPGSDHGRYEGKTSSFMFSPGRKGEQLYEDKFANEVAGSRNSDYSISSIRDPVRSDGKSPKSQNSFNSPPSQQVRNILIEDAVPGTSHIHPGADDKRELHGIARPQRTTSAGSFGPLGSNSVGPNSGVLTDIVLEPEHVSGAQQMKTAVLPSSHISASTNSANLDLFNLPKEPSTSLAPLTDLFADMDSSRISSEKKQVTDPFPENVGWATFDLTHHVGVVSETNKALPSAPLNNVKAPADSINRLLSMNTSSQWFPEQNPASNGSSLMIADQWHVGSHEVKVSDDSKNYQSWNAFDNSSQNVAQASFDNLTRSSGTQQVHVNKPPTSVDPYTTFRVQEVPIYNGFHKSTADDKATNLDLPNNGPHLPFSPSGIPFSPSVAPTMGAAVQEHMSTNPFDFPYDSDQEANNLFLNMNSLQASLPSAELPTTSFGGLSEDWFSQTSLPEYSVPSVPQGEFAYIAGQVPTSHLQNIPAEGPVASLGGNPFA